MTHDPALVEKAGVALLAYHHDTNTTPRWWYEKEAVAVLDAVADDLREQGKAEARAAVEAVLEDRVAVRVALIRAALAGEQS